MKRYLNHSKTLNWLHLQCGKFSLQDKTSKGYAHREYIKPAYYCPSFDFAYIKSVKCNRSIHYYLYLESISSSLYAKNHISRLYLADNEALDIMDKCM